MTTAMLAASPGAPWPALLGPVVGRDPPELWMPRAAPRWLARAPGPIGRLAARRRAGDPALAAPAMFVLDGVLRAWAGAHTDRSYTAELALRRAIDVWAAREVQRRRPTTVVAPTLAARRTLAAARAIARAILVLDLPLLRALHRDLDRAAARWPARAFLRRYRAPAWAIARQEAERVLADRILVRGPYARRICLDDGVPEARLGDLPAAPPPEVPAPAARTGRVRLAGLAAARHGIDTALAAARHLGLTLVVRPGEGTEPAELASLPGVATDDGPADAILCPAVCETYPPELRTRAVPVVASLQASPPGAGPDPFDVDAVVAALAAALAAP